MTKSGLKLGFIGLGVMGAPMAGHLLNAGHVLYVNTRSKVPQALADGGATLCTNARGVAERADIVFLMLPDTPDVEAVLFGEYGVAAGLARGKLGFLRQVTDRARTDDRTAVRLLETGKHPQQRRLADPVRADDADTVTRRNDERDTLEHLNGAKALRDVAGGKTAGHGGSSFSRKGRKRRLRLEDTHKTSP